MTSGTLISARNLTKHFGDMLAVDGVSFDVRQGECFGFLGPNGAGKTTIMRMIGCISPVTDGQLLVDGKSVARGHRAIKSLLGVVSQADSLDPGLSVIQNLVAHTRFFNMPRKTAAERVWETLDLFQLRARAHDKIDELSGGMRRRLLIARALLHRPRILILDEPTTGLDPQTRHLVWERLLSLKSRGITILLTTHYMDEAAYLCDRLVVMDTGRILVEGTPGDLVRRHAGERVVEIRAPEDKKPLLFDMLRDRGIEFDDTGESVAVYAEDGLLSDSESLLDGLQVVHRPANLEDVFLRLTGRGLKEE